LSFNFEKRCKITVFFPNTQELSAFLSPKKHICCAHRDYFCTFATNHSPLFHFWYHRQHELLTTHNLCTFVTKMRKKRVFCHKKALFSCTGQKKAVTLQPVFASCVLMRVSSRAKSCIMCNNYNNYTYSLKRYTYEEIFT